MAAYPEGVPTFGHHSFSLDVVAKVANHPERDIGSLFMSIKKIL